ncbi:hypothetical protein D3C87_1371740 [compost metagenome]
MNPVLFLRRVLLQFAQIPGKVTQIADGLVRDKASLNQAAAVELGNPLGILDVRLLPGHIADTMRVGQRDRTGALQNVPYGFPKDPCTFHGNLGTSLLLQPLL